METGYSSYDWDAVAWVVYNRIKNSSKTAYDEVTGGDFTAYDPNSSEFNFSLNNWYNTDKWNTCYNNAERLVEKLAPSNVVLYINNQKNFRRITTFIDGYDSDGITNQYFDGKKINNVAIPGTTQIPPSLIYSDLYYTYYSAQGAFNFYFSYEGGVI